MRCPRLALAGAGVAGRLRRSMALRTKPNFSFLPDRLPLLDWHHAWLHGAFDGAALDGRAGLRHSPNPGSQQPHASADGRCRASGPRGNEDPVQLVAARPERSGYPCQAFYLNPRFFAVRMVFYFAIWSLITYLLNKWSQGGRHGWSRSGPLESHRRLQRNRPGALRIHGYVCGHRLGYVA